MRASVCMCAAVVRLCVLFISLIQCCVCVRLRVRLRVRALRQFHNRSSPASSTRLKSCATPTRCVIRRHSVHARAAVLLWASQLVLTVLVNMHVHTHTHILNIHTYVHNRYRRGTVHDLLSPIVVQNPYFIFVSSTQLFLLCCSKFARRAS